MLDLDIIFWALSPVIFTVNVIKNGEITEKKDLHLPKQVVNVIRCKNPRCTLPLNRNWIRSFILADKEKEYLSAEILRRNIGEAETNKI